MTTSEAVSGASRSGNSSLAVVLISTLIAGAVGYVGAVTVEQQHRLRSAATAPWIARAEQPESRTVEPAPAADAPAPSTRVTTPRAVIAMPAQSQFRYAIGDRLKITLYEQIGTSEAARAVRSGAAPLVERTEFTGEYVVQSNGDVFLPLIGAVPFAQRAASDVQVDITDKARPLIGSQLHVSITVSEREAVYVTGTLQRTGAFRYSPGMVVAQVIALAGGGDTATGGDIWRQLDVAREQERLHNATERLKRNAALIDVLQAEQHGTAPAASARLAHVAGRDASDLISATAAARMMELARQKSQLASLDRLIASMEVETEASRKRLEQLATAALERLRRRDDLQGRISKGMTTEMVLMQARNDTVEIQGRWHEVHTAITRGESRIIELQRERDLALHAAKIDVEKQVRAARVAIAEDEAHIAHTGQVLQRIGAMAPTIDTRSEASYSIARRSPGGLVQIAADALTPLEPGDLVRVSRP